MLVCLLSGPGTSPCFIARVRGNIAYACVCKQSPSILCVHVVIVLGWREMRVVCSYIGKTVWGGGGRRERIMRLVKDECAH